MTTTLTGAQQTGQRVTLTASGLDTETVPVDRLTLWRDDLEGDRVPVRGFSDLEYGPELAAFVAVDHEGPLERDYFYVLELVHTDGTRSEHAVGPYVHTSSYPLVTNPLTGETVAVTLERWDEQTREGRGAVIAVADRVDPVIVTGGMAAPVSAPELRTDTRQSRRELVALLSAGYPVLLRVPEVDVEDAYLVVERHTESRLTNRPDDVRRRHVLGVRHVGIPELETAASSDDLTDLANAFPAGTLLDVSNAFGTLLELAAADLEAL